MFKRPASSYNYYSSEGRSTHKLKMYLYDSDDEHLKYNSSFTKHFSKHNYKGLYNEKNKTQELNYTDVHERDQMMESIQS